MEEAQLTDFMKLLCGCQVMYAYETFILVKSICLFMPSGLNDLSLCIQNFSLLFLSASDQ